MKKLLIFLSLFLAVFSGLQAQEKHDRESHRQKIKALKVAYITEELNMNTRLAQKFWPIYNKYEEQKRELWRREHIDLDEAEKFTEAQAQEMLKEYLAVEKEEYIIKKQLFADLGKILTAREIIKLHKLEADFNKKLLKEYRTRKENNKK
ncbi:hypothetical protein FHG64_18525 [Antarcticibacterium flavum]|uniref:Sensor of ECF-type sigma factor n=1 Tax=Antarcticibacterium flavum TaxID=2058175 RepID=A0A5B7X7X0_9FLAO|nr:MULTISPECIES: hypothetical protein [Antarcticibacterium]MCM4160622.1 hypothetical protein [Antarcticibacterium sp. W02-3]QCY71225.1 hypothetical protein FHG64_18525 [Antarcticibacterium flavum]